MPRMMLLTQEIRNRIPFSQKNVEDPVVHVKFFSCRNGWTWYATEAYQLVVGGTCGNGTEKPLSYKLQPGETAEDVIFYGLVEGVEVEWGSFSLNEFEALNDRYRNSLLAVERDLHWTPAPISQCKRT